MSVEREIEEILFSELGGRYSPRGAVTRLAALVQRECARAKAEVVVPMVVDERPLIGVPVPRGKVGA